MLLLARHWHINIWAGAKLRINNQVDCSIYSNYSHYQYYWCVNIINWALKSIDHIAVARGGKYFVFCFFLKKKVVNETLIHYIYCIVLSHSHMRKGQHNQQAGKLKREISPKYPQDKQKVESFTEEMCLTFAEETLLTLLNVHAGLAFWAPQSTIWAEKRKK